MITTTFGDLGISAFSIATYLISVVVLTFIGLAQVLQPLFSRSLSEGNEKKALKLNVTMSIVIYINVFIFGTKIINIFNIDIELVKLSKNFIDFYGVSFLFASVNIVFTTYFLSIKKTKESLIIAILRSFIINTVCIIVTPMIFEKEFIFLGIIIAEFIVLIVTLLLFKNEKVSTLKKSIIKKQIVETIC